MTVPASATPKALPAELPSPHPALQQHPGFQRLFQPGALTIGLILPLETHPGRPAPTMRGHVQMAQRAEQLGFGALWMRDVPFFDPNYGDVAQIFEPMVYISYLAAATERIALGTTGIVLPTREPMNLAKQATSLDQLSGGRLVLGLSSGDRYSDYPMFGIDYESRGERYRDAYGVFRTLSEESFPSFQSARFGGSPGALDLVPKAPFGRVPAIAVGQAQQSMEWLAHNLDGFLGGAPAPYGLAQLGEEWRKHVHAAAGEQAFKPLGLGGYLDLAEDPDVPFQRFPGGFRAGRNGLRDYLELAQAAGISHVALNPKVSRQPYGEILDELAEYVLPHFPSHP
ncbi:MULTISPECIES: LLM class oxidoreductase [Cupriavidus]|uniref:LLM class oxidoreductase n=1 Tax=Cupriavidus basilensis TaxID=68895 RepID=A0A643G1F6_9BURK|nr:MULTISPECIES: LLM class oxidoreductase [Cupriavidus]KUE88019.1 luciferase [Cupriavidus necator]NOV23795.1 LLM class oxidoreductase [Cupriavidus necator]QOT81844.1 LLM class oxidoreductase [Cupriavidus basilensis]